MNLYSDMGVKPRRELHVFYVLDTSGSMAGLPIATLNRAMQNSLVALKRLSHENGDAHIKISVLEFNTICRWMTPNGPEYMEDFIWQNLQASGFTHMAAAITELNKRLDKNSYLRSSTGIFMPVIIFMTDGFAGDDYRAALVAAMRNPLFRGAVKVGFAIGDNPDYAMIEEIVGSPDAVIRTTDLDMFAELLVFVTQSSSTLSITPDAKRVGDLGSLAVSQAREAAGLDDAYDPKSYTVPIDANGGTVTIDTTAGSVHAWEIPDL